MLFQKLNGKVREVMAIITSRQREEKPEKGQSVNFVDLLDKCRLDRSYFWK